MHLLAYFGFSALTIQTLVLAAPLHIRDSANVATSATPIDNATAQIQTKSDIVRNAPPSSASDSAIMKWFNGLTTAEQIGIGAALGVTGGLVGIGTYKLAKSQLPKLRDYLRNAKTADAVAETTEVVAKTFKPATLETLENADLLEATEVFNREYVRLTALQNQAYDQLERMSRRMNKEQAAAAAEALAKFPNAEERNIQAKEQSQAVVDEYWQWREKYTPPAGSSSLPAEREAATRQIQVISDARDAHLKNPVQGLLKDKVQQFDNAAQSGALMGMGEIDESIEIYKEAVDESKTSHYDEIALFRTQYESKGISKYSVDGKHLEMEKASDMDQLYESDGQKAWDAYWDAQLAAANPEQKAAIYEKRFASAKELRQYTVGRAEGRRSARYSEYLEGFRTPFSIKPNLDSLPVTPKKGVKDAAAKANQGKTGVEKYDDFYQQARVDLEKEATEGQGSKTAEEIERSIDQEADSVAQKKLATWYKNRLKNPGSTKARNRILAEQKTAKKEITAQRQAKLQSKEPSLPVDGDAKGSNDDSLANPNQNDDEITTEERPSADADAAEQLDLHFEEPETPFQIVEPDVNLPAMESELPASLDVDLEDATVGVFEHVRIPG